MPLAYHFEWDRIFVIKLIAITEMTVPALLFLLYTYLCILQNWASVRETRQNVTVYKWFVVLITIVDFSHGSFLACAANAVKKSRRPKLILWIIFDCFLMPIQIFLLRGASRAFENFPSLSTDIHFDRAIIVHTIYATSHLLFIAGVINFLAYYTPIIKRYDPSAKPGDVSDPTDPIITTTESRRIRFSDSFVTSARTSADSGEATTSTQPESEINSNMLSNRGFQNINLIPYIATFSLKKLPFSRLNLKFKPNDERQALAKIQFTNSTFSSILENIYNIQKLLQFVRQIRINN